MKSKLQLLLIMVLAVFMLPNTVFSQIDFYSFSETSGNTFTSIATTGTSVTLGDDTDIEESIGFDFMYNSVTYTVLNISSNGWLRLGTQIATNAGGNIGSNSEAIGVFYDDLNPSSHGHIYYEVQGTSPNRTFIVEYDSVQRYGSSNTGSLLTAQAVLYEGSNSIELRYGSSVGVFAGGSIGISEAPLGAGHFISVTPGTPSTTSTATVNSSITAVPADGVNYLFTYTPPSCPAPNSLIVTNILTNAAQLNWVSGGSSNYNVEYGPAGFTQGTGTMIALTDTFALLTGLTTGMAYDWYVQDSCGAGDVSVWAGPNSFNTDVLVLTVPSTLDFPNNSSDYVQLVHNSGSITELNTEANNGNGFGIFMTSNKTSYYSFSNANVTAAFTNTSQITEANITVNATSNSNLYMSLDLNTKTYYTNCTWFRIMLNGTTYVKSLDGDSVWTSNNDWTNIILDLSSVAGTTFDLSMQGALKYNEAKAAPGNKVYIDNIKLYEPVQDDLSVTALINPESNMCGNATSDVKVIVSNLGLASQSAVPVTAIITTPSGSITLTGVTGTIAPSGNDTVALGTVDASAYGVYNVVSYATLATDVTYQNNDTLTTSFEIYTPFAVDYIDDFDGDINWTATSGWNLSADHGKTGKGLYKNFYGGAANAAGFAYMTRKIGPITSGSALSFDYRLVEWSSYPSNALTMDADSFLFMISTDCGANFETIYVIDSLNHVTSTEWAHRQISLSAYVGQDVIIKVEGIRAAGDYYFDLDNYGVTTLAGMTTDATLCSGTSIDLSAGTSCSATLLFSSYIEGSSNNKALEIYNATGATINLDDYSIMTNYNGNAWSGQYHFPAGATLAVGDVFVLANDQSDAAILAVADDTLAYNESGYVVGFNGDDVRALFHKTSATDSMMIDIIGLYDLVDPGSGWDVAGVASATKDHTIIRKSNITSGNTSWNAIAGTDSLSSEYLVYAKNDFSMIGSHTADAYVAPTYLWSTGETTETITVNPTAATTYTVTITNTNCMSYGSISVTVNASPVVDLGVDQTIKWTAGTVTLDAGNPSATWLWNTGTTTQTETFDQTNLTNGTANTVYVEVTENGCMTTDTLIITVTDDVSINDAISNVNVSIYPNPNNGQFTLSINGAEGNMNMEIVNLAGQVVYTQNFEATYNFTTDINVSEFSTGIYYIKLSNELGVKVSKLVIK